MFGRSIFGSSMPKPLSFPIDNMLNYKYEQENDPDDEAPEGPSSTILVDEIPPPPIPVNGNEPVVTQSDILENSPVVQKIVDRCHECIPEKPELGFANNDNIIQTSDEKMENNDESLQKTEAETTTIAKERGGLGGQISHLIQEYADVEHALKGINIVANLVTKKNNVAQSNVSNLDTFKSNPLPTSQLQKVVSSSRDTSDIPVPVVPPPPPLAPVQVSVVQEPMVSQETIDMYQNDLRTQYNEALSNHQICLMSRRFFQKRSLIVTTVCAILGSIVTLLAAIKTVSSVSSSVLVGFHIAELICGALLTTINFMRVNFAFEQKAEMMKAKVNSWIEIEQEVFKQLNEFDVSTPEKKRIFLSSLYDWKSRALKLSNDEVITPSPVFKAYQKLVQSNHNASSSLQQDSLNPTFPIEMDPTSHFLLNHNKKSQRGQSTTTTTRFRETHNHLSGNNVSTSNQKRNRDVPDHDFNVIERAGGIQLMTPNTNDNERIENDINSPFPIFTTKMTKRERRQNAEIEKENMNPSYQNHRAFNLDEQQQYLHALDGCGLLQKNVVKTRRDMSPFRYFKRSLGAYDLRPITSERIIELNNKSSNQFNSSPGHTSNNGSSVMQVTPSTQQPFHIIHITPVSSSSSNDDSQTPPQVYANLTKQSSSPRIVSVPTLMGLNYNHALRHSTMLSTTPNHGGGLGNYLFYSHTSPRTTNNLQNYSEQPPPPPSPLPLPPSPLRMMHNESMTSSPSSSSSNASFTPKTISTNVTTSSPPSSVIDPNQTARAAIGIHNTTSYAEDPDILSRFGIISP